MRNRDCILYPDVGTFVLIRPTQTFYERINVEWVDRAMAHTSHQRVILDMDSSESPVHGPQEGVAYNGHFESVCYHPLFLFNHFGDCEGAMLRPGQRPQR